jgi:asparagine synthetase B (glutamine-hydrolysing)
MGRIVGALGPVEEEDWQSMLVDSPAENRDLIRQDRRGVAVRLGVAGPGERPQLFRDPGAPLELFAVADGRLDPPEQQLGVAQAAVQAWKERGADGLGTMRGEYSFGLWDGADKALIVGCDAVGLLAPAYFWDGRRFLFASRAIAILRAVGLAWNDAYVAGELCGVGSHLPRDTGFRGVYRMLGGELLRVSHGRLEQLAGARLVFGRDPDVSTEAASRELGRRLDATVVARLKHGKRACVALSGGIDSYAVASILARHEERVSAISMIPPGRSGAIPLLVAAEQSLQRSCIHRIEASETRGGIFNALPVPDDAVHSAPALHRARALLLRTARELGFNQVFDGEGSDEIFDIAFRPWLRPLFWRDNSFLSSFEESVSFVRTRKIGVRLRDVIAAGARHWRVLRDLRDAAQIQGESPFWDRTVVELSGSLLACVALDSSHSKPLVRRLIHESGPFGGAWRTKQDPLHAWLLARMLADGEYVRATIDRVKRSSRLSEWVDTEGIASAVVRAMQEPVRGQPAALVQLFAFVEWIDCVEQLCRS